jgi:hypothetical protein
LASCAATANMRGAFQGKGAFVRMDAHGSSVSAFVSWRMQGWARVAAGPYRTPGVFC